MWVFFQASHKLSIWQKQLWDFFILIDHVCLAWPIIEFLLYFPCPVDRSMISWSCMLGKMFLFYVMKHDWDFPTFHNTGWYTEFLNLFSVLFWFRSFATFAINKVCQSKMEQSSWTYVVKSWTKTSGQKVQEFGVLSSDKAPHDFPWYRA